MKKNLASITASALAVVASGTLLIMPLVTHAATSLSANVVVTLTITANCTITASPLPFGTYGSLSTAITGQTTLNVTCTNTTPYTVGLDAGGVTGSTVATRLLAGTATGNTTTTIPFQLYTDSTYGTIWGNTSGTGTSTVAGTGSGTLQQLTVYGRVPTAAITPQPDTYQSTVIATITF